MQSGHKLQSANSVRNLEVFRFTWEDKRGLISNNDCTAKSNCQSAAVYLDGMIYNQSVEQLATGFAKIGPSYVDRLEGSFVLFLLWKSTFYILTDKVNSRKAFYIQINGVWHISNDVDQLPLGECELNVDAIACYLANGILLNDLTLFKGVYSAKRACTHRVADNQVAAQCYWDYRFSYSNFDLQNEAEYQKQLQALLIEAVQLRASVTAELSVSLSAGYDVRGILGILSDFLNRKDVHCFSYALDDAPSAKTDAGASRLLASACGYEHRIIQSYDGDFVGHLVKNAKIGKCIANFCDELAAWRVLAATGAYSDIFAGDHAFGGADSDLPSDAAILDSIGITGGGGIQWLGNRISPAVYTAFMQGLDRLTQEVIARAAPHADPYDKRDYLRLDQRINHCILPWRHYISGCAGFIHNPFLDGKILDFMKRVPPQLRRGKRLYQRAASHLLPDLFAAKAATQGGYKMDWSREISRNLQELTDLIESTDSRLDNFVSKAEMIHLLKSQGSRLTQLQTLSTRSVNFLRRRNKLFNRIFNLLAGPSVGRKGRAVPPFRIVLRLLVLRFYLMYPKPNPNNTPSSRSPMPR